MDLKNNIDKLGGSLLVVIRLDSEFDLRFFVDEVKLKTYKFLKPLRDTSFSFVAHHGPIMSLSLGLWLELGL